MQTAALGAGAAGDPDRHLDRLGAAHAARPSGGLYGACYALLVVVALKPLWDGVAGYWHV